MDQEQFAAVVDKQIDRSRDILVVKAREYASSEDRLANFKVAAGLQGVSDRQALAGMMAKHTYSIFQMCRSDKEYTDEEWDEKITDHINYLLLLKAVTVEENAVRYNLKSVSVSWRKPDTKADGTYQYLVSECREKGMHLTQVDDDGYCDFCGWQYDTDPAQDKHPDHAVISYDRYANAADNRSKVARLETILKADLTPDEALSQATNVIFP